MLMPGTIQISSGKPVVMELYTPSAPSLQQITEPFERLVFFSKKRGVETYKVDINEHERIGEENCITSNEVRSVSQPELVPESIVIVVTYWQVPSFLLFLNGKKIQELKQPGAPALYVGRAISHICYSSLNDIAHWIASF
jgi:hypothetical protein